MIIGAVALALLAGVWSCAQPGLDPGPNPARLEIELQARMEPAGRPRGYGGPRDTLWDWGVYLLGEKGRLLPLAPVSGRRMKVIAGTPLRRTEVFLLPPGSWRVRLELEAYWLRPSSEGIAPSSLGFWRRQFAVELGPGQKESVSFSLGQ
jgi:hypothetical protein